MVGSASPLSEPANFPFYCERFVQAWCRITESSGMTSTPSPLERGVVDSLIVAPPLLGLVWSAKEWFAVGRINVLLPPDQKDKNDEPLLNKSEQLQNMNEISSIIAAGAKSFLKAEYLYAAAYIVLFPGVLLVATEWKTTVSVGVSPRSCAGGLE